MGHMVDGLKLDEYYLGGRQVKTLLASPALCRRRLP